ncbi:MAG: histidinol-phosphatase HisJ family protein [Nanoarchaeota archaeon]|nr:histidinol-phosphatase HisJ family protein [Nanoarchaeota archaeon]
MIDFHIHSDTSSDNKMKISDIYEAAAAKGIKHICITNHHEPSETKNGDYKQSMTDEELENTNRQIAELGKDGRLKIYFGVEMSYTEEEEDYIREYLAHNGFDFVLGSIHYTNGLIVSDSKNREKMKGMDHAKVREEYFRLLKRAIKTRLFDVMSHLDIYQRIMDETPFEETKKDWEEVARLMVENNVGFEINTSKSKPYANAGVIKPWSTYPSKEIIKLLVERGVKKITVGSDAHELEEIGQQLDGAIEFLKSLGVKEIYRFEKRKAIPEPI